MTSSQNTRNIKLKPGDWVEVSPLAIGCAKGYGIVTYISPIGSVHADMFLSRSYGEEWTEGCKYYEQKSLIKIQTFQRLI